VIPDANDIVPMQIDGAELLDRVRARLTKHVAFVNEHQSVAATLWPAATHALECWHHATRLAITSPQKRCAKSRLLDIVAGMSHSPMMCADSTTAAIYRSLGYADDQGSVMTPTLFVDEADALFGTKRAAEQNEDLRALFNAGFQRYRPVWRCVGGAQIPTAFNSFAMIALAQSRACRTRSPTAPCTSFCSAAAPPITSRRFGCAAMVPPSKDCAMNWRPGCVRRAASMSWVRSSQRCPSRTAPPTPGSR
jgi:hypothetical protein